MDLRSLETFLEVAERSSFTRAGEYLGYSQPTVSFQIRQLEQELGVPLFDRIGHTVTLTDAGREALDYAQRICNLSREMTMGARQDQTIRGSIRMGTNRVRMVKNSPAGIKIATSREMPRDWPPGREMENRSPQKKS